LIAVIIYFSKNECEIKKQSTRNCSETKRLNLEGA